MKKQLLKETEIRKMMKFANIGALTDGFVDRLNEQAEVEEPEEESPVGADAAPDDAEGDPGEEAGLEAGGPDDLDPEAAGGGDEILDLVADAMEAFKGALELAGPEGQKAAEMLQVEKEGEPGEEPEAGMDDMGDMDDLGGMDDLGDMGDMGAAPGGEAGGDDPLGEMVDEDAYEENMINEVARRVARRLRARV